MDASSTEYRTQALKLILFAERTEWAAKHGKLGGQQKGLASKEVNEEAVVTTDQKLRRPVSDNTEQATPSLPKGRQRPKERKVESTLDKSVQSKNKSNRVRAPDYPEDTSSIRGIKSNLDRPRTNNRNAVTQKQLEFNTKEDAQYEPKLEDFTVSRRPSKKIYNTCPSEPPPLYEKAQWSTPGHSSQPKPLSRNSAGEKVANWNENVDFKKINLISNAQNNTTLLETLLGSRESHPLRNQDYAQGPAPLVSYAKRPLRQGISFNNDESYSRLPMLGLGYTNSQHLSPGHFSGNYATNTRDYGQAGARAPQHQQNHSHNPSLQSSNHFTGPRPVVRDQTLPNPKRGSQRNKFKQGFKPSNPEVIQSRSASGARGTSSEPTGKVKKKPKTLKRMNNMAKKYGL